MEQMTFGSDSQPASQQASCVIECEAHSLHGAAAYYFWLINGLTCIKIFNEVDALQQ